MAMVVAIGSFILLIPGCRKVNPLLEEVKKEVEAASADSPLVAAFHCEVYDNGVWTDTNSGKVPLMVRFFDDSVGTPESYLWDFGDGNESTEQNPTYTYSDAGSYTVKLQVFRSGKSHVLVKPAAVIGLSDNPQIDFIDPTELFYAKEIFDVRLAVADDEGLESATLYIGEFTDPNKTPPQPAGWPKTNLLSGVTSTETVFTVDNLPSEGLTYLTAVALDADSPSCEGISSTLPFYWDLTPPTLLMISPTDNEGIFGTEYLLKADAHDDHGHTGVSWLIRPDGGSDDDWILLDTISADPFDYSLDTTAYSDGHYEIRATCEDNTGHVSTVARTVEIANSVPAISLQAPPSDVRATVVLRAVPSNPIGITGVDFYSNGSKLNGSPITTLNSGAYEYAWNTTVYTDGTNCILKAIAHHESFGDLESGTRSVNVDNSPPSIASMSFSPQIYYASKYWVKGTVSVTANSVADSHSGVDRVEFWVGSSLKRTDTSSPYTYSWETTTLSNGSGYTVKARVYDEAGNSAERSYTRYIDNAAPSSAADITYTGQAYYASKYWLGGPTSTTVTAVNVSDSYTGIQSVKIYIDGALKRTDTSAPYNYTWDTSSLGTNTSHSIYARITDNMGNVRQTATDTRYIDNTNPGNPSLSFSNSSGTFVHATSTITANGVSDLHSGVAKVEFYIDSSKKYTDTSSPYAYNWVTTGYSQGNHKAYIKVYDNVGNSYTDSTYTRYVDNTGPSGTILVTGKAWNDAGSTDTGAVTHLQTIKVIVSGSDGSGIGINKIRLGDKPGSASIVWASWLTSPRTSYAYTISSQPGNHRVYVQYEDEFGNQGTAVYDTIRKYEKLKVTNHGVYVDADGDSDSKGEIYWKFYNGVGGSDGDDVFSYLPRAYAWEADNVWLRPYSNSYKDTTHKQDDWYNYYYVDPDWESLWVEGYMYDADPDGAYDRSDRLIYTHTIGQRVTTDVPKGSYRVSGKLDLEIKVETDQSDP